MRYLLRLLPALATLTAPVFALPGDLDPTFGEGGMVANAFGDYDQVSDIAIQQDGKIVVAGTLGSETGFKVVRYLANGMLDESFGEAGHVATRFPWKRFPHVPPLYLGATGREVEIDDQGRILVAGSISNYPSANFAVTRYTSAGLPDKSFGDDGKVIIEVVEGVYVNGLLLQPDGKIVVSGLRRGEGMSQVVLFRLRKNGSLDPGFGKAGQAEARFFSTGTIGLLSTGNSALQEDGKIVVTASANNGMLLRFNTDGTLDRSFGDAGISRDKKVRFYQHVAIRPNGDIVVAATQPLGGYPKAVWVRYRPSDGSYLHRDATDAGKIDSGSSMALDDQGKMLIAGGISVEDEYDRGFGLSRLQKDGTLDPGFGTGGETSTSFGDFTHGASVVAVQRDGKILEASSYDTNLGVGTFLLARYEGGSTQADLRFGSAPSAHRGNDSYGNQATRTALDTRGPKTIYLSLQNDGTANDNFTLQGSGGAKPLTVRYLQGKKDVTGAIVAGTYRTASLLPGGIHQLKLEISCSRAEFDPRTLEIRAVSENNPAGKDQISIEAISSSRDPG